MLLRLTSVRELSLFRILSRVSSTLVGFGGSSGKNLNGSGFTTPECDKMTQLRLQREKDWNQSVILTYMGVGRLNGESHSLLMPSVLAIVPVVPRAS